VAEAGPSAASPSGTAEGGIAFEERRLDNGLRVIVAPDPVAPVAAINLWYAVGSKDEQPGKTGFAHLFEHFMFQGSRHVAKAEHMGLIQGAGGFTNATTNFDRTNYFARLPSNQLELGLWLEADRMGSLLDALSQENLDTQREIVKNEKRQSYDNQPYGSSYELLMASLFPEGHPYHHTPIGSMADLDAASLDDVQSFFRAYYAPNNAVLSIVGDVGVDEGFAAADRFFGRIPANSGVPPSPRPAVPTVGALEQTVPDDVPLVRVHVGFRGPAYGTPELDALEVALRVLSAGRSARLTRRLLRDEATAQDVEFQTLPLVLGASGVLGWATAKSGSDPQRVRAAMFGEFARLAAEPVAEAELNRAKALIRTEELRALEQVGEVADRLSGFAILFDDPDRVNRQLERYLAVTPEQVRAVAQATFRPEAAVVLTYVPRGGGNGRS
jgi:predicted Zn-dependent peptidase